MSLIVKTVTRLTIGIMFLFGGYIVAHGHLTPGGGFAGGVIVALVFVLYVLAYGAREAERRVYKVWTTIIESVGGILFLSIALLGLGGGYFFLNILPKGSAGSIASAGIIPLCNLAIMLKVSAGLFAVFLVLVAFRVEAKDREE